MKKTATKEACIFIFNEWNFPTEFHDKAFDLIKKFGLTFFREMLYPLDFYPDDFIDNLEKEMNSFVLFECKNWCKMSDIIISIFNCEQLEDFGLFKFEELIDKLERKGILNFYESEENNPIERQIICCKGYEMNEEQQKFVLKGYKEWVDRENFFKGISREIKG